MKADILIIKNNMQKPITKHIILLLLFTIAAVFIFIYFMGTASNSNQTGNYLFIIYSVLFILNYLIILIFKKRDILFCSALFGTTLLAIVMILISIFTAEKVKIDFNTVNGINIPAFYYFKNSNLGYFLIIFLIAIIGIFFLIRDEKSRETMAREKNIEKSLESQARLYYQYLFKGTSDLNQIIKTEQYNAMPFLKDVPGINNKQEEIDNLNNNKTGFHFFQVYFADLEIAGFLKNSEILGGDFYDVWLDGSKKKKDKNAENILNISLFDIMGHGLSVSPFLYNVIAFLKNREKHFSASDCKQIMKLFDTCVTECAIDLEPGQENKKIEIPATFCQINSRNNITFTNCGTPAPILYQARNGKTMSLHTNNEVTPGYGFKTSAFQKKEVQLQDTDDMLLLFTDGFAANFLIAQKNELEQFIAINRSAGALIKSIAGNVAAISKHQALKDDIVCIAVRKQ